MTEKNWTAVSTVIFSWDWERVRRDILLLDSEGKVHDPASYDDDGPAIKCVGFREKNDQ